MSEEEGQVFEQPQEEQPKKKKKSHKGAIVTWSIIGGVTLALVGLVGGLMLRNKINDYKSSGTYKLMDKTMVCKAAGYTITGKQGKEITGEEEKAAVINAITQSITDSQQKARDEGETPSENVTGTYNDFFTYNEDIVKFKDIKFTFGKVGMNSYKESTMTMQDKSGKVLGETTIENYNKDLVSVHKFADTVKVGDIKPRGHFHIYTNYNESGIPTMKFQYQAGVDYGYSGLQWNVKSGEYKGDYSIIYYADFVIA